MAEELLIATAIFSSKTASSTGTKQRAPGEGEVGSLTGTLGIHWLRTALSTETALIPAEEWRTGTRFLSGTVPFIKIQLKRETMCSLSAEKFQVRRIEQRPSTAFSGMEVPGIRFMPSCPLLLILRIQSSAEAGLAWGILNVFQKIGALLRL
jgi:hypothetical protein